MTAFRFGLALGCGALALSIASAQAQEPIKIGVVSVLTGPAASLGPPVRDGFQLAVDKNGGKLGGVPGKITVIDDELKPEVAVERVRSFVESEKPAFVVGPVFSNIVQAIQKPVVEAGAILISPNPGPSNPAGKLCHENFFVTSYQNDQPHEAMGKYAQDKGFKRAYLLAPNYQAGKDLSLIHI